MIKNDIKTNFLKIKGSVPYLRTEKIWGYPFKMDKMNLTILGRLNNEAGKTFDKVGWK